MEWQQPAADALSGRRGQQQRQHTHPPLHPILPQAQVLAAMAARAAFEVAASEAAASDVAASEVAAFRAAAACQVALEAAASVQMTPPPHQGLPPTPQWAATSSATAAVARGHAIAAALVAMARRVAL